MVSNFIAAQSVFCAGFEASHWGEPPVPGES